MKFPLLPFAAALAFAALLPASGREPWQTFKDPPHDYWNRPLQDRFTRLSADLASGRIPLDRSGEKAFVVSLLGALDIPVASQLLVYSTTSLQLSHISVRNPRALYFTDDLYVGWVLGGRIEIVSLDPELGGIYYIFDVPRGTSPLQFERATRCMNCHAGSDTGRIPGLVIESVMPGPNGGSLMSWRQEETGHGIPFSERFGGYHVTGIHHITGHKGDQTGELSEGNLTTTPLPFGRYFDIGRYPVPTSDIAAHLLHEHQTGFVNRAVECAYRTRSAMAAAGVVTGADAAALDAAADRLARYLLFTDEVALPAPGITPDPAFATSFPRNRRADSRGRSLKDLNFRTRMLEYRCSYMIYTPVFTGLPPEMKDRVLNRVRAALAGENDLAAAQSAEERTAIREILRETLPGLPADW